MILYNVTTNIPEAIHDEWLDWIQKEHIPAVLATGKFSDAQLVKVLVQNELGEHTYAVQFSVKDKATLQEYYDNDAPKLRAESLQKFGDKALSFRSELEVISRH